MAQLVESFEEFAVRMNCESVRVSDQSGPRTGYAKTITHFANGAIAVHNPLVGEEFFAPEFFNEQQRKHNQRVFLTNALEQEIAACKEVQQKCNHRIALRERCENVAALEPWVLPMLKRGQARIRRLRKELKALNAELEPKDDGLLRQEFNEWRARHAAAEQELHSEIAAMDLNSDE